MSVSLLTVFYGIICGTIVSGSIRENDILHGGWSFHGRNLFCGYVCGNEAFIRSKDTETDGLSGENQYGKSRRAHAVRGGCTVQASG